MDHPLPQPDSHAIPEVQLPVTDPRFSQVASYKHTAILIFILLTVGFYSAYSFYKQRQSGSPSAPVMQEYLFNIGFQWVLFGATAWGVLRHKKKLSDVFGPGWRSPEDGLMDFVIGGGFLVASFVVRAMIVLPFTYFMKLPQGDAAIKDTLKNIGHLAPHTGAEIGVAMLLALTAGIVEEFIFRGYLQRQFLSLSGSATLGIFIPGVIFALGHLYQGVMLASLIFVLGIMFGVLAHWRRNLRPGIIAHFTQDALSLLALSVVSKMFAN